MRIYDLKETLQFAIIRNSKTIFILRYSIPQGREGKEGEKGREREREKGERERESEGENERERLNKIGVSCSSNN